MSNITNKYLLYKMSSDSKLDDNDKKRIQQIIKDNRDPEDGIDDLLGKMYNGLSDSNKKSFECYIKRFGIENELRNKLKEVNDKFDLKKKTIHLC